MDDSPCITERFRDSFAGDGVHRWSRETKMKITPMRQIVMNSTPSFGQRSSMPQEPRFNQCGKFIPRDDQKLAQVVEEIGADANGHCVELKVVAIPDDVRWEICSVDGVEQVNEVHRT